jgi:hypothetical protein
VHEKTENRRLAAAAPIASRYAHQARACAADAAADYQRNQRSCNARGCDSHAPAYPYNPQPFRRVTRARYGGVAGLGIRIPFSPSVGLRPEGEDYFYGDNFDGSRKFQNDLVLSAGLALGW